MKTLRDSSIWGIHRTPLLVLTTLLCVVLSGPARAQDSAATDNPSPSAQHEFTAAADEVLKQMSRITGLEQRSPLKKTLRSREEIRTYVVKQMDEEKNAAERYAGARSAEAFGLLPKGFDLDSFMVELLTEQIAGLYDPKAHEFYIADWIPAADQKMVMAHELTHALEDQHFEIQRWVKAARPNDDAELAREAVLEGSAMAAMLDYMLLESGRSIKDLPEFDPSLLVGDMAGSPNLKKAPPFIQDALIFPYMSGLSFSVAALKSGGWAALPQVFAKPPGNTQQIMHPALYGAAETPTAVDLPAAKKIVGAAWTKLEENVMGEFGWKEVLKQFLGDERAKPLAAGWSGDRYIVFENKKNKRLLLFARLRLASEEQAARFFGQYSEALEKKHEERTRLFRRPNFFSFETPDGGVFLRCVARECVTLEGADRAVFVKLNQEIGWGGVPEPPKELEKETQRIAAAGAGSSTVDGSSTLNHD